MKKVWKVMGLFQTLLITSAIIFAGCNKDVTSDPVEEPVDYTLVAAGDEVTVNVGQTIKIKAEGKTSAEYSLEGLDITYKGDGIFEISAAATMSDTSVSVNFNDGTDSDDGIDITVKVYDPNYTLNITLDSVVAESAASISIYAEGKEDDETEAALKQTVNATYTAGATSASAKLAKDKANSWKFFNNIVVTVKDSDGNEIDVETKPDYFCYTDTAFTGITVSTAVASKTFTINFEGFTIPGGSVTGLKYSTAWANSSSEWVDATTVTPTVTVAADGTSASFVVAQTKEFYIDWTAVVVKDSEGNTISISAGNTDANKWYGYSEDIWSNTLTHVAGEYKNIVTDKAFTADAAYIQVIEADDLDGLTISTLKVAVKLTSASEWWVSASAQNTWVESTYIKLNWSADDSAYVGIITSEDFINAVYENGLYLNLSSDAVGSITVDYIE